MWVEGGGGEDVITEHHISTFDFIYINIAASKWKGLETGQEEVTVARS